VKIDIIAFEKNERITRRFFWGGPALPFFAGAPDMHWVTHTVAPVRTQ